MRDINDRSIRNISPSRRHKHHPEPEVEDLPPPPRHHRRRAPRRFWWLLGGIVVVCAVLGMLVSTVFAGATITAYPRTEQVTPPATLQAQLNSPLGVLSYQPLLVTRTAKVSVPAQGTAQVSRPASGVVTITNSYSKASQRLIANTRFATSDGTIYRVHESVTVPGVTAGKPGSATATIYADSPGDAYNKKGPVTLTIPGFKGDPRYTAFIATSQGDISGGFVGQEAAVAAADLAIAKTALQKQLDTDVRSAATGGVPAGSVAIPGTLQVTFSTITQTPGENKTATLSQSATANGVVIRQADLASMIARKTLADYKGEAVLFADSATLNVTAATSSKPSTGSITLVLSGQAHLVWQFDPNALKTALVGKNKSQFETVVKTFEPAVAKAEASIRPFWQGTFPSDPAKITVQVGSK